MALDPDSRRRDAAGRGLHAAQRVDEHDRTGSYSTLMPVLTVDRLELGVSPFLQWLLLPPLTLFLARPRSRHAGKL